MMVISMSDKKRKPKECITSIGLRDLLISNGVKPTGISSEDIKLAKKFMPKPFNNKRLDNGK